MHTQELGAAHPFHSSTIDGQRGVLDVRSPEVHNNLFCLLHIQGEIVVPAPRAQTAHLTPVVCLIVVADETHHGCVVRKLDDAVGVVQRRAVVGQQGEEEGAQHTSLGGSRVQGDGSFERYPSETTHPCHIGKKTSLFNRQCCRPNECGLPL